MSVATYLLGVVTAAVVVGSCAALAVVVRRRAFGRCDRVVDRLLEATFAVAAILGLSLLLGSVGAYRRGPLVIAALALLAVAAALRDGPAPVAEPGSGASERSSLRDAIRALPWPAWAAIGAGGLVLVRWVSQGLEPVRTGIAHNDVLHYHLPMAVDWVRSGSTWDVSFWMAGDASGYHPGNAELLHALGLLAFRDELLTALVNPMFALLGVAAAWRFGRERGNGPAGVVLFCTFLGMRVLSVDSGQVLNDVMPLALLVVALVFLDEARRGRQASRMVLAAGLAGGLAAGTKLTVVVPVVGFVLLAFDARRRARDVARYAGAALVGGGYWYLRNLVHAGHPVPALQLDIGPLQGPDFPLLRAAEGTIVEHLLDADIWRGYFLPGLRSTFGPLWPVLTAGVVLVGVATVLSPTVWRQARNAGILGAVAGLSFASYVLNPHSAAGEPGGRDPWLFNANQRYAMPALLLFALAALGHPRARRHPDLATAGAALVFVAASLWSGLLPSALLAVVVVAALAWGLVWVSALDGRSRIAVAGTFVVLALGGGLVLSRAAQERRWRADGPDRFELYELAQGLEGTSVGVAGHPQLYPFYGRQLRNDVRYVGVERGGLLHPARDCEEWWRAVERAGAVYLALLSTPKLERSDLGPALLHRPRRWLRTAGAEVVAVDGRSVLYRVADARPSC